MTEWFADAQPVVVSPRPLRRDTPIRPLSNTTRIHELVDDEMVEVTLPFTFWGETTAGINSNGYVGFPFSTTGWYDYGSQLETDLDGPYGGYKGIFLSYDAYSDSNSNNANGHPIGPFDSTTCYYGDVAGGGWGVTWTDWGQCCGEDAYDFPATFQIVIWPDGSCEINVEKFPVPASERYVYAGWRIGADLGRGSAFIIDGSSGPFYNDHMYDDASPYALSENTNTDVIGRWVFSDTLIWSGAWTDVTVTALADGFVREAEVSVDPLALAEGNSDKASNSDSTSVTPAPAAQGDSDHLGDGSPVTVSPATYALGFQENENPGAPDDEWSAADAVVVSPTALSGGNQNFVTSSSVTAVSPVAMAEGTVDHRANAALTRPTIAALVTGRHTVKSVTADTWRNWGGDFNWELAVLTVSDQTTVLMIPFVNIVYRPPIYIPTPPVVEGEIPADPEVATGFRIMPRFGLNVDPDAPPVIVEGRPT